ncbi:MAG: hypothetical protein K8R92_09555 [Planctomycetes bacterium]|nr:hypothetical protein [Planctomycetota bacterium]
MIQLSLLKRRMFPLVAIVSLATSSAAFAHDEEKEIHIGRNSAGQLVAEVAFHQPGHIEVSVFPGYDGYATGLIGIHSAELDEPDEDFYTMSETCDIQAIFVSADYGLKVYNGPNPMSFGDIMPLGTPFFDYHPVFHIFDGQVGESFELQMYLHDVSGQFSDSEIFTVSFAPEPEFGDINEDGSVDGGDLGLVLLDFGPCDHCETDLDESGEVDGGDVGLLLLSYS